MRIQILLFTVTRIRIRQFTFDADPDLTFHFTAYPDPTFLIDADQDLAPHQRDGNLRPLACRPFTVPLWSSTPPLWAFMALCGSILKPPQLQNFDLIRIRSGSNYYILMRMRILLPNDAHANGSGSTTVGVRGLSTSMSNVWSLNFCRESADLFSFVI
jgi:hypothetical protein